MNGLARGFLDKVLGKEKFNVFLLEDNALFLHSLKAQLTKDFGEGISISAFSNSVDLKNQMSECPKVVVMDYHLDEHSDIEGVELIKRLKWSNPSTKIIVLTSEEKVDVAMHCYEHGADNYIKKDINAINKLIKELVYKKDLSKH